MIDKKGEKGKRGDNFLEIPIGSITRERSMKLRKELGDIQAELE